MFLKCSSIVLLLAVFNGVNSNTLGRAYDWYLRGVYDSSYQSYTHNYEVTGDLTALYGMINSLAMLKRYDEAILLCHTDSANNILVAKELWILGLMGDEKRVDK